MLGASPPERPASIQVAAITGAAAANSLRVAGGMVTRGISERSAPGVRVTLSGDRAMTTIPRIVTMVRTTKMIEFAVVVNWIATPASKEPKARPPVRPTLPRVVPSRFRFGGASSTSAAVNAVVATPVAAPCTMRPAITHPISVATRNMTFDASWMISAPISTGRRPTWSESDPSVRRAARKPIA